MAKDPVCGMDVDEATAKNTAQHDGQTYYFCAPGCKKAFETEPRKYLDSSYTAHM
jgi:YHS domain-containing protein